MFTANIIVFIAILEVAHAPINQFDDKNVVLYIFFYRDRSQSTTITSVVSKLESWNYSEFLFGSFIVSSIHKLHFSSYQY